MIPVFFNNQKYTDENLKKLSITQLSKLAIDLQDAIHATALTKRNLIKEKKFGSKEFRSAEIRLAAYTRLSNHVSYTKHQLRDSMERERNWYKKFYTNVLENYNGTEVIKDMTALTNADMGYNISEW